MKPRLLSAARLSVPLASAIAGLLAVPSTHAATLYWDGNDTTGNADGGAGTWNNVLTNWDTLPTAGANSVWTNATPDSAVLGGVAGAVALGDNIDVGGLRFNTTGYGITSTGFSLNFLGTNSILFNNIAAATITGPVGGTGSVTLSTSVPTTAGTLTLNGTSAGGWSGTTTINNSMTLALSGLNQGLASTTGGITLNGGGITLTNVAAQATLDRVNGSAITSNGGTITYANTATASTAYAETIGSVALTSGQLNVVLSADQNAATNSQTLTLGGLTQTGTSAVTFSAATTAPNATTNRIAVTGATATPAGQIIGPWATTGVATGSQNIYAVYNASGQIVPMTVSDTAETTWTNSANTYSGIAGITLTATRTVNALRYYGGSSTLALGNFNLQTYGLLFGGNNAMTVASAGTGVLTTPSGGGSFYVTTGFSTPAHVISAPINNNGGNVTVVKSGAGALTLSSITSNYSGGTVINAGTLTAALDANLGAAGAANGITFNGSANFAQGSVTYLRNITINNGAIAHFSGNSNPVFSGNVTGTGGVMLTNGFGTQINFSGTANNFEGPVLIAGTGTSGQAYLMQFTSFVDSATANGRIRFSASTVTHANGSVFQYNGSTNLTLANRQIEIASTGGTPTNGHQIRSSGAGTLSITSDLIITSTTAQRLSLGGSNAGANNFTSNISNGSSSALGLTKANNGNWNLSGTNTYTGTTVMGFSNPSGGNLTFQGIQALSNSTTLSQTHAGGVGGFGTFKILDDAVTPALRTSTNIAMASSNTTNGLALFVGNNNTANGGTSAGVTTGSTIALGNLTMTQTVVGNTSQTLTVAGANSYRLQINNVTPSLVAAATGYTASFNPTSAPLTIAGTVQQAATGSTGGVTLNLDGTNAGNQVTGNILNSLDGTPRALSITKTNSSTWTLSGTNSFSGGVTLSGASVGSQLNINSATALGTGTFTINGGNNAKFDNTTASAITLSTNNAQNWSNDFAFVGTRDLNMGTGAVTLGGTRGVTVTANTLTVGGVISGATFGISKGGNGTLVLSGSNSYSGVTTVTAGVLEVATLDNGSSNSGLGSSSNAAANLVFGAPTATLRYTGGSNVTIDRGFTLSSGAGGGATIESSGAGTLSFDNTVAINYGTASETRTLTLGGTNTGANTFGKVIANNTSATSVVKAGAGTWVLDQANTYTGTTTVSAGVLETTTLASGSSNSGIGASSNAAANLVFGAPTATLRYTGGSNVSIDRGFTMSSGAGGGATIESSGAGTLSLDNVVALSYGTVDQTRALTLGGTNVGVNTFGKVIANNGTGATSLTKAGAGTWVLDQANTYGGGTTVSAGTLALSNASAAGTGAILVSGGSAATLQIDVGITLANSITFSNTNAASRVKHDVAILGTYSTGTTGNLTSSFIGGQDNTTAEILGGTSSVATALEMLFSGTSAATNDGIRRSDVFTTTGTSTDTYVIQLSTGALAADSVLGWLDGANWVHAGTNFLINTTYDAGTHVFGDYGYDSGNVWAVVDHGGSFAAVPEPTSAFVGLLIGAGLLRRRRSGKF